MKKYKILLISVPGAGLRIPILHTEFLAVYWSLWRRLLRGSSGNVETPQACRGGSRSPRGKRSHERKGTAAVNHLLMFNVKRAGPFLLGFSYK